MEIIEFSMENIDCLQFDQLLFQHNPFKPFPQLPALPASCLSNQLQLLLAVNCGEENPEKLLQPTIRD
jgi:hypothetical protein